MKTAYLNKVIRRIKRFPRKDLRGVRRRNLSRCCCMLGMTETVRPWYLGTLPPRTSSTLTSIRAWRRSLNRAARHSGFEWRSCDDAGTVLPGGRKMSGRLRGARRSEIAAGYFKATAVTCWIDEGFFDTGDVANIDEYGTMKRHRPCQRT